VALLRPGTDQKERGYAKMVPSRDLCFQLMDRYGMWENIKAHSIMVQKISTLLADSLRDAGENLHTNLVTAGALMHDIGKSLCLESGEDHAAKGVEICLENHLEEIAGIVGEHIRLKHFDEKAPISEKEIVYYADKRVNHDRIVSLDERLDYLLAQYGRNEDWICQRIRDNFLQCREVEKKLFRKLTFGPEELRRLIE
jgi:putative nucleotidyltransferase with HDIG domain